MLNNEKSKHSQNAGKAAIDAYTLFLVSFVLVVTIGTAMQVFSYSLGRLLTEVILIFLPAVLYVRLKRLPIAQSLRWNSVTVGLTLRSLLLGISAWGMAMLIYLPVGKMAEWIFGPDPSTNYLFKTLPKTVPEIIIAFLIISILPGICEETLFRGAIQGTLEKKGPYKGLFLAAVLFAAYHLNPWSFLPAFALGVLFGFLTVRTNSVVPAMICHASNNATAITVGLLFKNEGHGSYIIIALLTGLFMLAIMEFIYHTRYIKQIPSILTKVPAGLPPRLKKVLVGTVLVFVVLLVLALIQMRLFFRGYRMTSEHLVPQVYPGDRVLVLRSHYFNISIQPGDIVAFGEDGHTVLRKVVHVDPNSVWVDESAAKGAQSEIEIPRQDIVGKMVYKFSFGQ